MFEDFSQDELKLMEIFTPYALARRKLIIKRNTRFVHYTSAENAFKILTGQEMWMRDVRCMNDFTEVEHGHSQLVNVFRDKKLKEGFYTALDQSIGRAAAEDTIKLFDQWSDTLRQATYITSISEHDKNEDDNGRLSMWRAYGKGTIGIALVIKNTPFMGAREALQAYGSPVSYLTNDKHKQEFRKIVKTMGDEKAFLSSQKPGDVTGALFNMLIFAAVCSKHPGFSEEREWRILHIPSLWPSPTIDNKIEVVGGTPQKVYKIPLKDIPEKNLSGIAIPDLIDRIIIGPSDFPGPIRDALIAKLEDLKVPNAHEKVFISGIPLRV